MTWEVLCMSKLPVLEQRIKERIHRLKNNVQPWHNKMFLESLKIEIETLNWVLNEIISLSNNSRQQ
jgi:hypothetical protein